MKNLARHLTGLALLAGAVLAPALAQMPGGTLRFVPQADVRVLDPMMSSAYVVRNHGYLVFDTLFALNGKFEPKPQMAESAGVSADGKAWTIKLRSGLKWHDGKPVRAADCVASLERWMKRSPAARDLSARVEGFVVDGDKRFTIKLTEPYALMLETLAIPSPMPAFMMPERLAGTDANTPMAEIVGSGPFMFDRDEWQPGKKLVYTRFTGYLPRNEPADLLSGGKVARLDRIEWIVMPDANAAAAALEAGEVDMLEQPSFDVLKRLKANPDVRLQVIDPLGEQGILRANHLYPPFNNPKARQALEYLVNQKEYGEAIAGDPAFYRDCEAYLVCGGPYGIDTGGVPFDLQKAKELLKEAGYNGEKVVLLQSPTIPHFNVASQITAQNLRKAGINLEVVTLEWGALGQRRGSREAPDKGGWNLLHTGFGGLDARSPLSNIAFRMDCSDTGPSAFGWPCDKEFERLRTGLLEAGSEAARKDLAAKLQARANAVVPHVLVGQFTRPLAYRANVKGVLNSSVPVFWNVTK